MDGNPSGDDNPLAFWKMFVAPMTTLFSKLDASEAESSLESVISSIIKSRSDLPDLIVPNAATAEYAPHYVLFDKWILSRLVYVLGIPNMKRIHQDCVKAQLKLLSILYANEAQFYDEIMEEYVSVLKDSLRYYAADGANDESPSLNLFSIKESTVYDILFTPIFLRFSNRADCKILIQNIVKVLYEVVLFATNFQSSPWANKVFVLAAEVLEDYDFDLKMSAVDFYIKVLERFGFYFRSDDFHRQFLRSFRNLLSNVSISSDLSSRQRTTLSNKVSLLFRMVRMCGITENREVNEEIIMFCMAILRVSNETDCVFRPDLIDCIHGVIGDMIDAKQTVTLLEHEEESLVGEIPSLLRKIIVSEINESTSDDESDATVIDVHSKSKTFRRALDSSIAILAEAYSKDTPCDRVNSLLTTAMNVMTLVFDIFIELHKTHESQDGILDFVFGEYKAEELKRLDRAMSKKLRITFVPKDKAHVFACGIYQALTKEKPHTEETLVRVGMCMEFAMFVITMSAEIVPNDLVSLQKVEYFPMCKAIHALIVSIESHPEVYFKSLNILLSQRWFTDVLQVEEWKEKVLLLLKLCDLKNSVNYYEILRCIPLLILNNIMPPNEVIVNYLYPALNMKNDKILETLLDILPTVVCVLSGYYALVLCKSSSSDDKYALPILSTFQEWTLRLGCLHCLETKFDRSSLNNLKTKLRKDKSAILLNGSRLRRSNVDDLFCNLKSLFEKFIDAEYIDRVPRPIASRLISTFAWHSMPFPASIYRVWFSRDLLDASKVLRPFMTSVLNNKDIPNESRNEMFSSTINILLSESKKCLETNNSALQDDCLEAILELGKSETEMVLLPCLKLLLIFLMHPRTPFGPKASFYIKVICKCHATTPNESFHKYKKDLCRIMMDLTVFNFTMKKSFSESILKVVDSFGFASRAEFLFKDFHHALPFLVCTISQDPSLRPLITQVAELIPCEVSDMLVQRFPQIYAHIYLHESEESAKVCYRYIEEATGCNLTNFIKKYSRMILTELLLQYNCDKEKVIRACKQLANVDVPGSNREASLPLKKVAEYIQPRFLGVLASFDSKFVNSKSALSVKRKALESFPHILYLMGAEHMTPLKYKILATLRTSMLLIEEFPAAIAEAWIAFIRNVDTVALGDLLPTIFASLLPLILHVSCKVHEVFEYLIVKNENILSGYIANLFFVQKTNIDDSIKSVVMKHVAKKMPEGFVDKLKWYMKYLDQDAVEIKIYALEYLHDLIKENRCDIDSVVFGNKSIDSSIVKLLEILISGCRDKDSNLALWSGRCLGQFGALQPSMLPQVSKSDFRDDPFTIKNTLFAKRALTELIRAFQYEKFTKDMDCYALAIQEILKTYKISPEGENKAVWESFPDQMQEIMSPLLSSRYTIASPTNPAKVQPVFGSKLSNTMKEWAYNWIGQLIPHTENYGIQDLLRMVYPALKKDFRTLIYFLPYVILHIITSTDSDHLINNEIMAVIGLKSFGSDTKIRPEISKNKMMRNINLAPAVVPLVIEEGTHIKCCKTIYGLLDFLNRWLSEWCYNGQRHASQSEYQKVSNFMDQFCKLTVARGNFLCGELERALLYLEGYMGKSSKNFQEQLTFLAEIYTVLNEPDSVAGIMSMKQNEPTLSELILAHEVTGQLQDAATCYEKYAQQGEIDNEQLQGMVQIYLGLDQPFTALQLLRGAVDAFPENEGLMAEPFWRLGMFDELEGLLARPRVSAARDDRWGASVGRCLLALRGGVRDELREKLERARRSVLRRLSAATSCTSADENAYAYAYSAALDLHSITEVELAEEAVQRVKMLSDSDPHCNTQIEKLIETWNLRMKLLQSSANTVEPVLRLRRILLEESKELLRQSHPRACSLLNSHIGKLWLQSAKLARKASIFQQAYIYILNGEKYSPKELFIEKAKLYWMRGQQEPAFCTLKRGLEEHFSNISSMTPDDRKLCAKAKLSIAIFNDETINVDMDVNIANYKDSVEVYREWEKSLVCLGEYYEKVYAACGSEEKKGRAGGSARARALECYGKALLYGHKRLYQSMPRMLSIWLDFEVPNDEYKPIAMSSLSQICSIIETYAEKLPLYLFLTAFSQIISRICHPIHEVYLKIKSIIIKLIIAYPQHALWMMMCVIKSSYPQRIKRCQEILNDPQLRKPAMQKLIYDFNLFAEKLIELCNKPIPESLQRTQTTHVAKLVKSLPKLLESPSFSHIMIPHEQFVKIVLPFNSFNQENKLNYNPFPTLTYITGIEDQITILPSLQKPRKITLNGSDGKKYIIMLKPKDDLRKDFRLMEFNAVVNRYLQENPDSRQRRLYIRTYTVLPLNEECGLIEWIPNLLGLRPILLEIYRNKGISANSKELKSFMCKRSDPLTKMRQIFEQQLLPRHPPVFGEWFKHKFPEPRSWYQARSAYIRTTAVMSMVGYILGLGDRHGENVLFDSTNGDTVHVDFNVLFNKGEEFEWPERVPFRLTHNMQSAMGPLSYEGMYRKCCEITMKVLRAQTTTLMSVIRPFVYDPLVTWQRNQGRFDATVGERTNQSAREHLAHIEQRLKGMVRTKGKQFSLSLSPEGQTNNLILEAVSVNNLCQMYLGWGPFL